MRARWASVDENIGTKICWKLVEDNSGEIINQSTIRSTIESGAAKLQVHPLETLPKPADDATDILNDFMSEMSLSHTALLGPVNSVPASTKSQVWQEIVRGF